MSFHVNRAAVTEDVLVSVKGLYPGNRIRLGILIYLMYMILLNYLGGCLLLLYCSPLLVQLLYTGNELKDTGIMYYITT